MVYIAQQSFGFGEVDPNIRAQYESQPYQRGCQTLTNALLSSTGSAAKRWGSVDDTAYQTATEKSYQYVTGYGDRIMIYGGTTTYSISSFNHPVQTFTGMILDVAYRGPDLIVLTNQGLFRHEMIKSGTTYSSLRYTIDISAHLINSTPPVTMKFSQRLFDPVNTGVATVLTSGSGWFDDNDDGDMYVIPERLLQAQSGTGPDLLAPASNYWGRTLTLNTGGYISPTSYNCSWNFHQGGGMSTTAQNVETLGWAGPYRNWLPVGKVLNSLPDPGGASTIPGVIYGAVVNYINIPGTVQSGIQTGLVAGGNTAFCPQIDSDIQSVLEPGKVGKIVITFNMDPSPAVKHEQHFFITNKQIYDIGTPQSPTINIILVRHGIGEQNTNPSGWDSNDGKTLQIFLASSDGLLADGLPTPKNGFFPSILVRDRTSKSNPSTDYDSVQLVGSGHNNYKTFNATTPQFAATGRLLYPGNTQLPESATYRNNNNIGEVYPIEDSGTFRISEWEIEEWGEKLDPSVGRNVPVNIGNYGGPGWGAHWKLTGNALNHFGDTPAGHTQDITPLSINTIEIHQERTFLAGFDGDTVALSALPEIQNLGLTIISSKSNELTNFNTGSLDADGLSFIISSKAGGKISWLKSQFNQLFVGTTQEEYVITSVPISSGTLNVELQSSYGSEYLKEAIIFGNDIVFIPTGKKTIRAISYAERRQRYETEDLFQFAKHLTKNETIERVELVSTEFQRLFARTNLGNLYCFSKDAANGVYGWSQWNNSNYGTIEDIVGTVDDSGNASLWARVAGYLAAPAAPRRGIYLTSDPLRSDYHVDGAIDYTTGITTSGVTVSSSFTGDTVSAIVTDSSGNIVYIGNAVVSGTTLTFGTAISPAPSKVVIGYPYTMTLAPNIPELMVPGKGSTLGREKNVSRLRILFNQVRGAVAAGYELKEVPATIIYDPVADAPGFYSVPVVGEYGSQPTINITQSAPYGFEISGYNAEYDFGD